MTRKEMVDAILEALPKDGKQKTFTRLQVEVILETHASVAAAELLGGGEITIQGMGKLKARERSERKIRNPRNGEEMLVPACKKVVFVPFGDFREALK